MKSDMKIDLPSGNGDIPKFQDIRFYETRSDLPKDLRVQVVELLSQTLVTTIDLKTQVKQAHWNVKGPNFYQLHLLFDEIATQIDDYVDLIAERITTLGGTALGTVRLAAQYSELREYPVEAINGAEHVTALTEQIAPYAQLVRTAIDQTTELGDADTADLYTEISRTVDKYLWFLESYLQA